MPWIESRNHLWFMYLETLCNAGVKHDFKVVLVSCDR